MDISLNQIVHSLVGLVKYVVALILLVAAAKILPNWLGSSCYIDSEDHGMREAIGKTTLKLRFDRKAWTEGDIRRGDIVILMVEIPSGGKTKMGSFPYRAIAVEGDIIEAKRGIYKINGEKEKYTGVHLRYDGTTRLSPQRVPRGYVYILPDDRKDNKGGLPGMVPAWRVQGKAQGT
jgi:hypothetical protein